MNWVQGGEVGAALSCHPELDGVAFTGSWATGRRILEANLDQPGKLIALEMGGRNAAVVLEDAHLEQAVHEIVIGSCLTAGQRCTATSRVLVHKTLADRFISLLLGALRVQLATPCWSYVDGPLATQGALVRYEKAIQGLEAAGINRFTHRADSGGAFVYPSVHSSAGAPLSAWKAYVAEELFGPNIALEIVDGDEDAKDCPGARMDSLSRFYEEPYSV